VQPFIENAIWHGLLPKKGEKYLSVRYMITKDGIDCVIEDNGIGREAAAEIKMKKLGSGFFASKAIGLVQQRMKVLGQTGMVQASFSIIDKKAGDGEATGTKVIISIPHSKNS
jgi:LytS/YehU family sensor histidine kinase